MIDISRAGATTSGPNTWSSVQTFNGISHASIASLITEGSQWNDSTQRSMMIFLNGIQQELSSTLFTQTADKSISNTVAETSIFGTGIGSTSLPTNFFTVGKTIRLLIGGVYSTPIATTPSVLIKVKLGSVVIASVTTTGLLSGASNLMFNGECILTCRSVGVSGSVIIHGSIEYSTGVAGTINVDPLNNAGASTTIDTTASNLLDVTITWDAQTTTRIVKSTITTVEVLN